MMTILGMTTACSFGKPKYSATFWKTGRPSRSIDVLRYYPNLSLKSLEKENQ